MTAKTPLATKAKFVASSIAEQWDKCSIPHEGLSGRKTELKVERLISRVRDFKKGRDADILGKFGKIFDIARCKCLVIAPVLWRTKFHPPGRPSWRIREERGRWLELLPAESFPCEEHQ